MRRGAGEEPTHEVHDRLQIVHGGHGVRGPALWIDEVCPHERDTLAELHLGALALALDDPCERAVIARFEQFADDRATQSPGPAGHEHTHDPGG